MKNVKKQELRELRAWAANEAAIRTRREVGAAQRRGDRPAVRALIARAEELMLVAARLRAANAAGW